MSCWHASVPAPGTTQWSTMTVLLQAQVPDLDAIIQTSDFPCMLRQQPGGKALPPPVFGYNSHARFVDVPFPDYSYWGHEYHRLLGARSMHSLSMQAALRFA